MFRTLWKKISSLERRTFLLAEIQELEKKGVTAPAFLRSLAVRSPSEAEDYVNFLRFLDPKDRFQLVDIGANRGEWCEMFLDCFPNTQVTAIEPAGSTFKEFTARFAGDNRVKAINAGASDRPGSATLLTGPDSTLNSFQEYADTFAEDRGTVVTGSESVPLVRVDDVVTIDSTVTARVLKIDVQGHEVPALRGAAETLKHIDVALCELSFVNEYVNVPPSFPAVTSLLAEAGLYPVIFQEYGVTVSNHRLESDVVYVRDALFPKLYR